MTDKPAPKARKPRKSRAKSKPIEADEVEIVALPGEKIVAVFATSAPAVLSRAAKNAREARTDRKRGTTTDDAKREHKAALARFRSDVEWLGKIDDLAELGAQLRRLSGRALSLAGK